MWTSGSKISSSSEIFMEQTADSSFNQDSSRVILFKNNQRLKGDYNL
jgi:hypothetical protein